MATNFDQVFPLRDADENLVLFSPGNGSNYMYQPGGAWIANPIYAGPTGPVVASTSDNTLASARVTRSYVDGNTFICYSRITVTESSVDSDGSLFYFQSSSGTYSLVRQNPQETPGGSSKIAGVPSYLLGKIDAIASSNGYLILASDLTVYWALFDGTQFNFELTADGESTGSGFKVPEDIKGRITAIVSVSGGFIIFTNKNAVAAMYSSSNFENPWLFREVANCGGVEDAEKIALDQASGSTPQRIIVYTTGGLQSITLNSAETIHPTVTDFLCGKRMERWDLPTHTSIISTTTLEFFTKLAYIGNRYLIISYGSYPGIFSWALFYDMALQRWGKLRIVHTDCFPYLYNTEAQPLTYGMLLDVNYADLDITEYGELTVQPTGITYPKQAVGFLLSTGEVKLAVLDAESLGTDIEDTAVCVIGRIQLSRTSLVSLLEAEVEGASQTTSVFAAPSYDGRNLSTPVSGVPITQAADYLKVGWEMLTAKNFNIILEGQFHLTTLILEGMQDGRI